MYICIYIYISIDIFIYVHISFIFPYISNDLCSSCRNLLSNTNSKKPVCNVSYICTRRLHEALQRNYYTTRINEMLRRDA